jgi:hypothetical protein
MSEDRNSNQAQGETHGREQQPVEVGERDTTQQEQERSEGRSGGHDPAAPDADVEDSLTPTSGGESQAPGDEFVPREGADDQA